MRSTTPIRWFGLVLAAIVVGRGDATCFAQQQFQLVVEGDPGLSSTAVLSGQELIVTDAQGVTFQYVREPQLDTPDGQFLGFFNAAAQQALRWPAAGQGAMLIGDPQGQNWRASAQRVQPVRVPGGPVIRPRAAQPIGPQVIGGRPTNSGNPRLLPGQLRPRGVVGGFAGGPMHIGIGADSRGRPLMAVSDPDGIVRLFDGGQQGWVYRLELPVRGILPGTSLVLTPDVVPGQPRIFTVDATGALVMLAMNQGAMPIAPELQFPPGAVLTSTPGDPEQRAFAIDIQGRLWNLACHFDRLGRANEVVENDPAVLTPGAPVHLLTTIDPTSGRSMRTLFVTDSHGTILQYQSNGLGGWSPRLEVAIGFVPGAPVGGAVFVLPNGQRPLYLAAVDWRGQLQLLFGSPVDLQVQTLDSGSLPPGANVLVLPPGGVDIARPTVDGPLISAIGVDGVWRVWRLGTNGGWDVTLLQAGFPPGAPVYVDPLTGDLLAVDVRGRVIPAHWNQGDWDFGISHPTFPQPPRLVSRRVIPNQPLPPANVTLVNGGAEEIAIQIADAATPANSREVRLPAGGAEQQSFERDAGATIEEVYLVPDPVGGWTEQVSNYPIPPQPRYALAVWANRTTYQYINKNPNKPKGALPDFDLKSHVSLGVLDLPPGDLLRDGEQIDVHAAAVRNRNPGAAGHFATPSTRAPGR